MEIIIMDEYRFATDFVRRKPKTRKAQLASIVTTDVSVVVLLHLGSRTRGLLFTELLSYRDPQ